MVQDVTVIDQARQTLIPLEGTDVDTLLALRRVPHNVEAHQAILQNPGGFSLWV